MDVNGRYVADKAKWPYAFGHWMKTVGIQNGRPLDVNDLFALAAYHADWDREGIKAPIYYSRATQDMWDRQAGAVQNAVMVPTIVQPKLSEAADPVDEVDQFVRFLFAPYERGWIELRCLRFPHNQTKAAAHGLFSPGTLNTKTGVRTWRQNFSLTEVVRDAGPLRQMAQTAVESRFDVYLGVLPRGVSAGHSRKDAIYEAGALWAELDFDKQGGEEATIKKAKAANPDMIVRSGGGVHCYWLMTAPLALDDSTRDRFEMSLRARQEKLGTDRTHDCTRILRLPGTYNFKSEPPRKVELIHASQS